MVRADILRFLRCGSWAENGPSGSANDYVLALVHRVIDGYGKPPNGMRVGSGIYALMSDHVAIIAQINGRPSEVRYQGIRVEYDKSLQPDELRFFLDGLLVGECSGWTA